MPSTTEQLITLQELVEILQTTDRTIYAMIKNDEIPYYRISDNGPYRFNKQEVLNSLKRHPK